MRLALCKTNLISLNHSTYSIHIIYELYYFTLILTVVALFELYAFTIQIPLFNAN